MVHITRIPTYIQYLLLRINEYATNARSIMTSCKRDLQSYYTSVHRLASRSAATFINSLRAIFRFVTRLSYRIPPFTLHFAPNSRNKAIVKFLFFSLYMPTYRLAKKKSSIGGEVRPYNIRAGKITIYKG